MNLSKISSCWKPTDKITLLDCHLQLFYSIILLLWSPVSYLIECMFFYKHNTYKHDQAKKGQNIKHMLSIMPRLDYKNFLLPVWISALWCRDALYIYTFDCYISNYFLKFWPKLTFQMKLIPFDHHSSLFCLW